MDRPRSAHLLALILFALLTAAAAGAVGAGPSQLPQFLPAPGSQSPAAGPTPVAAPLGKSRAATWLPGEAPPLPNNAYRLPEVSGMPEWARSLYRDDIRVNALELDAQFALWKASQPQAESEEAGMEPIRESPWEEYYERWRRAVSPFVQPDGTVDFSLANATQTAPSGGRVESPMHGTSTQAATWSYFGPGITYHTVNDDPGLHPLSWQSNIYCLDIAPSNHSYVYYGSEMGCVGVSTDKGGSWTTVGQDYTAFRGSVYSIAVDPTNPSKVWAGSQSGVSVSTNGGVTWALDLTNGTLNPDDLKIRPDSALVVLAAGASLMKRAVTGGWSTIIARRTWDLEFQPGTSSVVYALVKNAAGDRGEFYKSTDGGLTFSIRQTGWIGALGDAGGRLAVSVANPSRVYAVLLTNNGQYLMRSFDAGETWTTAASSPASTDIRGCGSEVFPMPLGQGYYDLSIAASQSDANKLIVGTTTCYRSNDSGATYVKLGGYCGAYRVHPDIQDMKSVGGDTWIASDGGIDRSSDFFTTQDGVISCSAGLRGTTFWGLGLGWNEDVVVGGLYHNGSMAWREGYPSGRFLTLGAGDCTGGYVNPANSRMLYLNNYGGPSAGAILPAVPSQPVASFTVSKLPNRSFYNMELGDQEWDPRCSNTYYLGDMNVLYRTTDNGTTFTPLANGASSDLVQHIKISRANPNVWYVTIQRTSIGDLYKTVDGGLTFRQCANPPGPTGAERRVSTIALSGTDPNTLWWAFRNGSTGNLIFKSTDGGASWTNLTTPTLNGVVPADMLHQLGTNGGIYLLGSFGKVYYRNDAMADWVSYSTGLPAQLSTEVQHLGIQYKYGKLRLASVDGVWQAPLFENSTTTLVQPMVDKLAPCVGDTAQFESYSVVNGPASYHWAFAPAPQWISDANARNPRVLFGPVAGPYTVTLQVTDANGVTSRTLDYMIANGGNVQWADSVVAFSSQYGAFSWDAKEALGPPTIYPLYGDDQYTWASLDPDATPEFLDLHFPTPKIVNFVQVIETFNPGALTTVSVKNPNTNLFQQVWHAPASPAPPVSRAFTARFQAPAFLVNEVRLDFDSPAVPGWNEVDAVGLGYDACAGGLVGVDPVERPLARLTAWPNPSLGVFTLSFEVPTRGPVRLEVYDVSGRRVARLVDAKALFGSQNVTWDGRSRSGARLGAGLYFAQLQVAGKVQTAKLMLTQ